MRRRLLVLVLVGCLGVGMAAVALPIPVPTLPPAPVPPQVAVVYLGAVVVGGVIAYIYDVITGADGQPVAESYEMEEVEPEAPVVVSPPPVASLDPGAGALAAYEGLASIKSDTPLADELDWAATVTEAYLTAMLSDSAYLEEFVHYGPWQPGFPYLLAADTQFSVEHPTADDMLTYMYSPLHGRYVVDGMGWDSQYMQDLSLAYGMFMRGVPDYLRAGAQEGDPLPLQGPRSFAGAIGTGRFWTENAVYGRARFHGQQEAVTRMQTVVGALAQNDAAGAPSRVLPPFPLNQGDPAGLWEPVPRFVTFDVIGPFSPWPRGYGENWTETAAWANTEATLFPLMEPGSWTYGQVWVPPDPLTGEPGYYETVGWPGTLYQVHLVPYAFEIEIDWGHTDCEGLPCENAGWMNPAYMQVASVVPVVVTWRRVGEVDACAEGMAVCIDDPNYTHPVGVYEAVSIEGQAGYAWSELVLPRSVLGGPDSEDVVSGTLYDLLVSAFPYESGAHFTHLVKAMEEWWRGAWLKTALGIAAPPVTVQSVEDLVLPWDEPGALDYGTAVQEGTGRTVLWLVDPLAALEEAFVPSVPVSARVEDLVTLVRGKFPFALAEAISFSGVVGAGPLAVPAVEFANLRIEADNSWLNQLGAVTRVAATTLLVTLLFVWLRGKVMPRTVI